MNDDFDVQVQSDELAGCEFYEEWLLIWQESVQESMDAEIEAEPVLVAQWDRATDF